MRAVSCTRAHTPERRARGSRTTPFPGHGQHRGLALVLPLLPRPSSSCRPRRASRQARGSPPPMRGTRHLRVLFWLRAERQDAARVASAVGVAVADAAFDGVQWARRWRRSRRTLEGFFAGALGGAGCWPAFAAAAAAPAWSPRACCDVLLALLRHAEIVESSDSGEPRALVDVAVARVRAARGASVRAPFWPARPLTPRRPAAKPLAPALERLHGGGGSLCGDAARLRERCRHAQAVAQKPMLASAGRARRLASRAKQQALVGAYFSWMPRPCDGAWRVRNDEERGFGRRRRRRSGAGRR